jgi:hypothetical protein
MVTFPRIFVSFGYPLASLHVELFVTGDASPPFPIFGLFCGGALNVDTNKWLVLRKRHQSIRQIK